MQIQDLVTTKKKAKRPKGGFVVYEGKSQINGENIVGIITMSSKNEKTGNMASLWILNADMRPTQASKMGKDESVCGQCPMRHALGGACYVTLHHAPTAVYKAYKRGNYKPLTDLSIFNDVSIRFGAYGDPYALPMDVLANLKANCKNNTSYTHQWKDNLDNEVLKSTSMASVDSVDEIELAVKNNWRYFRVAKPSDSLMENEILCPNTTKGIQCIDCGLCSGNESGAKNIVIMVHGAKKNKFINK